MGPWYGRRAVSSAYRLRMCGVIAALVAGVAVAGCGGGQTQAASEPSGKFPVAVDTASFPASQKLAEKSHLVIAVRNTGGKAIPDVAVTICNVTCTYPAPKGEGTSAAAFGSDISQPYLANPSRPIWIVNAAPGPCEYSCRNGGAGAAVTAYSNTWALGRLAPGHTARFDWSVTAVKPGRHVVAWEVAAGLNGKAKAVLSDGSGPPRGTFTVDVGTAPPESYVNNNGQIVTTQ
jgi:hypothetical protein